MYTVFYFFHMLHDYKFIDCIIDMSILHLIAYDQIDTYDFQRVGEE